MPGNTEGKCTSERKSEKEKCLEKLNQMQKYIPFLDFMIDKIKKKNNEKTLECQLSKFKLLRSMVAEKNGKYAWDVIVKAEDVIEKLISKLDFKEQYEKSKEKVGRRNDYSSKASMATSVSIVPSSSTNVSVTTTSSSQAAATELKPQDFHKNTVDLIMKTLKSTVDSKQNQNMEKNLGDSLDGGLLSEVSGKTIETDLDKDLDGFDLTEYSNPQETVPGNAVEEPRKEGPEKTSSHDDLLFSSREKLLRALFPGRTTHSPSLASQPSTGDKSDKGNEPVQSPSAFSRSQTKLGEKSSDSEGSGEHNKTVEAPVKNIGGPRQARWDTKKSFDVPKKFQRSSGENSVIFNLKQKLKEKLSTDICEVYRVPGKSVGGSLRSLKESKDLKKNFEVEEVQLLKLDNASEMGKNFLTSITGSDGKRFNSPQGSNDKREWEKPHKHNETWRGKNDKKAEFKNLKNFKNVFKKKHHKNERRKEKKKMKGIKEKEETEDKGFEVEKMNDDELLDFVKENMQSLPHLATLEPSELRKMVKLSMLSNLAGMDMDGVSEISEDSFQDFDDAGNVIEKEKTEPKHPLAFLRVSKVGFDGIAKNVKPIVEPNKETTVLDEVGDKTHDLNEVSRSVPVDESLNEEDYALKLIEETTSATYPGKKRGLLDLPLPATEDLFDDIPAFESSDVTSSPSENRDIRLANMMAPQANKNKPNPNKIWTSGGSPHTTQNFTIQRGSPLDPRLLKQQLGGNFPNEGQNPSPYAKALHQIRQSHQSPGPKSYAEYKRLKLKEQGKLGHTGKELLKNAVTEVSNVSQFSTEKNIKNKNTNKNRNRNAMKRRNSSGFSPKQNKCHKPFQKFQPKKKFHKAQSHSDHGDNRSWEDQPSQEVGRIEEKRLSLKSDELVSPLEELYGGHKSKTGRGYGIQKFKIPKKVLKDQGLTKENKTDIKNPELTSTESDPNVEIDWSTENWDEPENTADKPESEAQVDSTVTENTSEVQIESKKTEDPAVNEMTCDTTNSSTKSESLVSTNDGTAGTESKSDIDKTEAQREGGSEIETVTNGAQSEKPPTRCEAVECDSSVESPLLIEQISAPGGDKNTAVAKEEITQEFVEALIRKSFQSGEGKLLLAQVKLFEELARKLNSKKLKTIQKIINSESGCSSSSSSSSTSSEDEKKKKKVRKSEQKTKKRKKKGKKRWKQIYSSSSSSSESEETTEDNCDKKEERSGKKSGRGSPSSDLLETASTSEETKPKSKESSPALKTGKKRRRNIEKQFNRKRSKRKQKQKKLLEKILCESPQPDVTNDSSNTADVPVKEPEPKSKPKTKAKAKTELDRLHEDIRSMFISAGVVTATGQRMCRMLKQSGGNMNNLDIVKESAKMVEEEKLRKVETRASSRNSRSSDNRSRSQSLDKGGKPQQDNDEEQDWKLKTLPQVTMQRVDLDNFGYGIKVSEGCISFRRMRGRNTAIRGARSGVLCRIRTPERNIAKNVFLQRNKRKFELLKDSKRKTGYVGKKLMDVVKNLPLKMAKMKHLQICERKLGNETVKKKKSVPEKFTDKTGPRYIGLAKSKKLQLLHYAFEKTQRMYTCKLCTHVTRNITMHYLEAHPENEVLISRLCLEEARAAKIESSKNNYTGESADLVKKKSKTAQRNVTYNCRMCYFSKVTDVNSFAAHVGSHTGELQFRCPSDGCTVQVRSRQNIRFHILTKHPRDRYEYYDQVVDQYSSSCEEGKLFGFLCYACNFVQICRDNLVKHMLRQHDPSENARFIKINLSSKKSRISKFSLKSDGKGVWEENDEESRKVDQEDENKGAQVTNLNENKRKIKRKKPSQDSTSGSGVNLLETKKVFLENAVYMKRKSEEGDCKDPLDHNDVQMEDEFGDGDEGAETLGSDIEVEDCVDLKCFSSLRGSDIISSVDNSEPSDVPATKTRHDVHGKLKVGPLEAMLLGNAEVKFECYVKGCLFSTRAFKQFEKHIQISHWMIKWSGVCEICNARSDSPLNTENSLKSVAPLSIALKHLKLHEREINEKLTAEDLMMELKLLNSYENSEGRSENGENEDINVEELKNEDEKQVQNESSESPYPERPLLRVRNFLGDRLSTPKGDEGDVLPLNEEESNSEETSTDSSKMFTIENVRSLTGSASESEIKIEQVCSLKNLVSKPTSQLGATKAIIVRSSPSRKIAIRPEPSTLSVDVAPISIVQPPVVGHPVVLSPIANNSPIRIISTALSPKSKLTVQPILVPTDPIRLSSPNMIPVVRPTGSPSKSTATMIPVCPTKEVKTVSGGEENMDLDQVKVEGMKSPTRSKSPTMPTVTIHHHPKNSSVDMEEADGKETTDAQRLAPSPSTGKKTVKDAKIYQEMLTKTKLCHLFKCMGIECSFTCNNENVFTQHLGLHEAQRRLKRGKGIKMIYLKSANKTTRAFYWQQCAYCCEVLSSNNNKALSQHILEEHGHCMYQCAFCFYRAVSQCYVEIHQNLAHAQVLKTTSRVIYKCKPLKTPPSQVVALEKHGRKQSVRPYQCDQCGRKFYITNDFTNHLTTEHQAVTAYTCHICKNLCFKVNRLINHYKLHSYSTYQCAYCLHGTETQKEMIFHLCNFHFSQPAIMYVRALSEGQSIDEKLMPYIKKKYLSNQLDQLKVIIYESDSPNLDCIVEVDGEDDVPDNVSESSLDLSSIVAELGIYTDPQTSGGVTPLMKELASIGECGGKNLTVKTLLPNAQFSSENETGQENCSVLISSGLSVPADSVTESEMSIPLGQLPLEAVNVHHKDKVPESPSTLAPADKNLKLNEIIVNQLHQKDIAVAGPPPEEERHSPVRSVHKLPPVVVNRRQVVKSMYSSKNVAPKKKSEDSGTGNEVESRVPGDSEVRTGEEKHQDAGNVEKPNNQPLITKVVSLSKSAEDSGGTADSSIKISNVCSLYGTQTDAINKQISSGVNKIASGTSRSVLKPPIIRVEDFRIDEDTSLELSQPKETISEASDSAKKAEIKTEENRPSSPDIIILENKAKDIVMVTLDSDEEREYSLKKKCKTEVETPKKEASTGNETIRMEMERLRNQIANETDSLLLDDQEAEDKRPKNDLTLSIQPTTNVEDPNSKTLLSPIEEAICSLNKKLQSETQEAQKKKKEEEKKENNDGNKTEVEENTVPDRRRTRFGARDRKKRGTDGIEKSDGDDSGAKKDDTGRSKRFKEGLSGKQLFICGNEKCTFAADDDSALKDHLYVCDLSRESSVLVCPHCSRQAKQFHPYLEHLKYHGEKKFHCGLCDFTSAVDSSVSRHVKQKHKCSLVKILPKDSKEGHFQYYPKNYKIDKVDFEVNGYSPGDEDKLPLQSVYQVNVKCAKCPYFTKVRSNMVRHLKIHVKSVETEGVVVVPSTAPTNPVPCLETKERMFDKMTNLAASSQLAQAKEKTAVESLSPEEEAKLPQFVAEQMRYKCCLPDCNYITIDDGMLKHHIKALHDEINYYSCPHCKDTVHVDVRHVTLDKIGFHLKHHDTKLYKCPHCIFFHYQKNVLEKHTAEKHPDRKFFVHTVREPKLETASEEVPSSIDAGTRAWKCGLCDDFRTPSKQTVLDHLMKIHNTKSKYKCKLCPMKGNNFQAFSTHFVSKHPGVKVSYVKVYYVDKAPSNCLESGNSSGADSSNEHFDTTPLWQRGAPRIRHIRGILIEEEEIKTKKSKRTNASEAEANASETGKINENAFYCPLCTNKKKPFFTRNEDCFRSHLYQELNYQQFACILCGKMFVDRKDFERHHSRVHTDKPQSVKQTKEDHEIKFWVDQVIAKRRKQMEERKRKHSESEAGGSQGPPKKKKEG